MSRFNRGKLLPCFYHINTGLVSAVLLLSLNLCAQAAVINNPPTATSATIIGKEDTKTSITLKGKDLEKKKLTYAIVNQPTYGTVTLVGSKATYTPSANYFNTASTPDRFTFKTNDGLLDSVPATVDIVVKAVNDVPVVQKGIATTLQDTKVDITLMGSDVEGDPLTYVPSKSKKGGTVAVKSGNTVTFTPKKGYVGADSFTFTAKDSNKGISKAATVSITVSAKPPNVSPTANAGADQAVNEKMSVTLDGSGSKDSDGSIVSYRWMQRKQPLGIVATLSGANTAKPTFTAPELVGDTLASATLAFDLTVTDNNGAMATDTVVVVINNVATNIPPGANAGNDKEANENTQVTLDGTGSTDSDGNLVKYEWKQTAGSPTVTLTGADTAKPTFTAPDVAADTTLTFELTVTDNQNATSKDTVSVQVKNAVVNIPPVANPGGDQTVNENTLVTLDGSASKDSDGSISGYLWTQTGGMNVALTDPTGNSVKFISPYVAADETLTFALEVMDDKSVTSHASVNVLIKHDVSNSVYSQVIAEGSVGILKSKLSTTDYANIKSIVWTQTSGQYVDLSQSDTLFPLITTPEVDEDTTVGFNLTVQGNDSVVSTDTIIVKIRNDSLKDASAIELPYLYDCVVDAVINGVKLSGRLPPPPKWEKVRDYPEDTYYKTIKTKYADAGSGGTMIVTWYSDTGTLSDISCQRYLHPDNGDLVMGHLAWWRNRNQSLQRFDKYIEEDRKSTAEGEYKEWYEDGKLRELRYYENNEKQRLEVRWSNSELGYHYQWIAPYNDDLLHGIVRSYYKDGHLDEEYMYSKGKRHGPFVTYHSEGSIMYEKGSFADNVVNGPYVRYYFHGGLEMEGTFDYEKKVGLWSYYNLYNHGKIEGQTYFDPLGKIVWTKGYDVDTGKLLTYCYYDSEGHHCTYY